VTESEDPACLAALATEIGHAPPFSSEELAGVRSLTITHARDLQPIAGCVGLERLRLVACDVDDLLALDEIESVTHVAILCTRFNSPRGLIARNLRHVEVLFSSLNDASKFLAVVGDWQGTLIGNPMDELSRGALDEKVTNGHALVDLGSAADWEECQQLWERLGACSGKLAGYPLLVRPGIPTLTKNTYDAIQVMTGTARSELRDPDVTLEKLFAKYADRIEAPDLSELAAMRILGRTEQAKQWIAESALPAPDKAALDRFVSRFPKMVFYRVTKAANDRKEAAYELKLPDGYRAIRETLDGWWPQGFCPPVQFDKFEDSSPREDRVQTYSYYLGLRDHGDDQRAEMLKAGFIIIGWSRQRPISALAIRLDGEPTVYEYSPEDIGDAISDGGDVTASIYPVFRSYAAMLGHIDDIHLPDDDVLAGR
jgi:hypothetical protein